MKAPKINQAEDKILDDYLKGKSHLSDSYKQMTLDLPGIELDSSILAAARREVNARPKSVGAEGWRKWQKPLSIAAVLVISASLTLTMVDFQNKSDEITIDSAPIVIKEETKEIRGDSFGLSKADSAEANKATVSPARKLEPVERAKQKMAPAETSAPKAPDTKMAQSMKTPPAHSPTNAKAEPSPQAFPTASVKAADANASTQANIGQSEPARSESRQVAPLPATPTQGDPGKIADQASVATARTKPMEVPASAPAAPAPAIVGPASVPVAASAADAGMMSAPAKSARIAANAPAAASAENARAGDVSRKTVQASESTTAATYAAAQTWLAKIEALLRDGKTEEAEQALAEFKLRFPNYVTPDSIKEELAKQRAALNAGENK